MKKVFILCVGVAFVASMTSCKKDWNCKCTVNGQEAATGTFNATKKDAQDACDALGTSSGGSCELTKN